MVQTIDDRRSAFSDLQQGGIIIIPWIEGMEAGIGYDFLTQKLKGNGSASEADLSWKSVTNSSQTYNSQIRRIESNEELSDSLEISSSVSGGYGGFSATATGKFMKSVSVTSYSIYFLIDSFVQNSAQKVGDFFLDDSQRNLSADQFYQKFGDYYVSGFISGGSFVSLLEMQTQTREVKEEISAGVEAKYGAGAFSIGAKFSTDIKNASKHSGVQLQVRLQEVGVSGASDDLKDGGTVDDLIAASNKFPDRVKNGGKPLYAILTPYSVLKNPPQTINVINIGVVEALRQDMNSIYLRAKTVLESVTYALGHPGQFPDESDAKNNLNQIKTNMEKILVKVANANNDLNSGKSLDLVQQEIPQMPDLNLIPQRLWGGTKDNIVPPENVIPSTIQYKIGDANTYLWNLRDDKLKASVKAYLDQVSQDLATNFGNSYGLIEKIHTYMGILIQKPLPNAERNKLLQTLQDETAKSKTFWSDALINQKAMFAEFDTSDREKDNQLQVIKNLNAQIWSSTETQYGGSGYWNRMEGIIDQLKTNVSNWDANTPGDQYISFKTGAWDLLKEKFHDAMENLHSSPLRN